jgi:hypothetical protein
MLYFSFRISWDSTTSGIRDTSSTLPKTRVRITRFVYLVRRNIPEVKEGTVNFSLQPQVLDTVDIT